MLAGGVNLVREPRNGRNFEYGGEDPLLAGVMVGAQIAGIQSNHIVSTHQALRAQRSGDGSQHAERVIDRDQARMSDLLAFQIAIERVEPRLGHVRLQQGVGRVRLRKRLSTDQVLRKDWGCRDT